MPSLFKNMSTPEAVVQVLIPSASRLTVRKTESLLAVIPDFFKYKKKPAGIHEVFSFYYYFCRILIKMRYKWRRKKR